MLTAILSFLGSAFFRAAFERIVAYFESKAESQRQMDMMKLSFELDKQRAELKLQQTKVEMSAKEMSDWMQAMSAAHVADATPSGIKWIDGWNKAVRPALATILILFYVSTRAAEMASGSGFGMNDFDQSLLGSVLGYFVMDRSIVNRNR